MHFWDCVRRIAASYLPAERVKLEPTPELFLGGKDDPLYKQYAEELKYLEKSGLRSGIEARLANERHSVKLFNMKVFPYDWSNTQQDGYKRGYDDSLFDRVMLFYSLFARFYKMQQNNGNASKYAEPESMLEYMSDDAKDSHLN